MEAALEAYLVDPGDPGTTPAEIIAEVIAARGVMPSLDDRLDVSLNEDGTLKAISGAVTQAQLQSIISARNIIDNGDFEDWTAGGAAAPDNWTLAGAGAAVAKTGPGEADTFTFGTTQYAAKLTRAGADASLTNDVIAAADFANYVNVKGQKITVSGKVKAGLGSQARLRIDDGITQTNSSFHTGNGLEQHLSAVHTVSASATKLSIVLQVITSDGAAYFGGIQVAAGDFAPTDWMPKSQPPLASATRRGLIGVGAQSFEGIKTFLAPPVFQPGTSSASAIVEGVIDSQFTQVGNVGAAETDLMKYTIPANVLSANGKAIKVACAGNFAANAANKQIRVYVFGATPAATENLAYNGKNWYVEFIFVRRDSSTVVFSQRWHIGTVGAIVAGEQYVLTGAIGGIDFSIGNEFKLTGDATNTDDITQGYMLTEVKG